MKVKYHLLKKEKNTKARLGKIETNYGTYETPMFMPVGTQATVKTLSPEEVKECKAGIILANTYHLWLKPGEDVVFKAGGLHKFMNWDGPILTDSGGFQVFSLAKPKDITEEGVHFKNIYNGDSLLLTPEKSIEIQNKLDSDIAMSFDECVGFPHTREYVEESVERTLRWAKRGKDAFANDRQSLFGIVQGAEFEDLRKHCAEELVKMDFDGYSIGGTAVGEAKDLQYLQVEYSCKYLPEDKVRYLMGVGDPIDIKITGGPQASSSSSSPRSKSKSAKNIGASAASALNVSRARRSFFVGRPVPRALSTKPLMRFISSSSYCSGGVTFSSISGNNLAPTRCSMA